jgi:glycosyltransferase involved in cell wall biosynthesis
MGDSRLASIICASEMLVHDIIHAYSDSIDCFIAPSWFMADKLVARGIPREKVVMIPSFVDTSLWPLDNGDDHDYIFFWGRTIPRYGIDTLVRAVAALSQVKLKIVSTDIQDQETRELAWELGAHNIEFLGYRDEEDIRKLVSGSRFVCLPFESPGSAPMEMYEAFAAGKPVLTTNIGALPELVRDGVTGRLAVAGDVESLRETIESLWSDPAVKDMGVEARRRAEEDYSPARHYERISEVYRRVRRT